MPACNWLATPSLALLLPLCLQVPHWTMLFPPWCLFMGSSVETELLGPLLCPPPLGADVCLSSTCQQKFSSRGLGSPDRARSRTPSTSRPVHSVSQPSCDGMCQSLTFTHKLQAWSLLYPKPLHSSWHMGGLRSALVKPVGPHASLLSVHVAPGLHQAIRAEEPLSL